MWISTNWLSHWKFCLIFSAAVVRRMFSGTALDKAIAIGRISGKCEEEYPKCRIKVERFVLPFLENVIRKMSWAKDETIGWIRQHFYECIVMMWFRMNKKSLTTKLNVFDWKCLPLSLSLLFCLSYPHTLKNIGRRFILTRITNRKLTAMVLRMIQFDWLIISYPMVFLHNFSS